MKFHSFTVYENELLEDPFTVFFSTCDMDQVVESPSLKVICLIIAKIKSLEIYRRLYGHGGGGTSPPSPSSLLPRPSTINGCEFSHTMERYLHPFKTYHYQTWQVYYFHGSLPNGGDGFC